MHFSHTSPAVFIRQRDQLHPSLRAYITLYNKEEYLCGGATLYLSHDLLSGFGITTEGELISVFSLVRGRGVALVAAALELGATRLDCLGEHLRALYEGAGLVVTSVSQWSDEYAPADWNYERFGRPAYYEMRIVAHIVAAS